MLEKFLKSQSEYFVLILIVLVAKIATLVFISFFSEFVLHSPRASSLNIFELWNVWDAPHYLSIAEHGYQTKGVEVNFIVFLPFLPLLIALFKNLLNTSYLVAGYIVPFFSSIGLAIMLYKLTRFDFSKKFSFWVVGLLFLFPTSFFLHNPYTESLFILLCVSSFFFARKKYFFLAFLAAGLAGFTRLTGLALIPALMFEIYKSDFGKERKVLYMILGTAISASGFLFYLFINYYIWGNFLQFSIFEKQNWHTTFSPFGQGLFSAYESISWRVGLERLTLGYGQIIAFIFGLIMSLYVLVKIRVSYGIFMLFVLWFSSSMSFWLSMPRYILSLFPMFICLALLSRNFIFKYTWILISTTLLIILGSIFIQYGPVF